MSTAYHPASHCWLTPEAKQGWSWSVPGWETDAAGSGVGGAVGGTFSSGLKKIYPRAVIRDLALCRVLSFGLDVKWVS